MTLSRYVRLVVTDSPGPDVVWLYLITDLG